MSLALPSYETKLSKPVKGAPEGSVVRRRTVVARVPPTQARAAASGRSVSMRSLPLALAFAFLLGAFAVAIVAPGVAAKPSTLEVPDATGDVKFVPGNGAISTGPPSSNGLDLKGGSIFAGDGRNFLIRADFVKMSEETTYPPGVSGGDLFIACFTWNTVLYGVRVEYRTGNTPVLYKHQLGPVTGVCDPVSDISFPPGKTVIVQTEIDFSKNRITVGIDRLDLGKLSGGAPPAAGDAIGKLRLIATEQNHNRYDAAPDTAPVAEDFILVSSTTNVGDLLASSATNVLTPIACDGRVDAPTYVIDAGGARGVPIDLRNKGAATRHVKFFVETLGGLDWKPRVVPQLDVQPSEKGNTTITLIVDMPAVTKHKDCTILHLVATDAQDPNTVGDASVNVIAVRAPDREAHKLYMHASEFAHNACDSRQLWLNVLQEDPAAADGAIMFKNCRDNAFAVPLSTERVSMTAGLDVNPSRDLVVNTSATGKPAMAVLKLQSEYAPTTARILASLQSGRGDGDLIAEGTVDVQLTTSPTEVQVPLTIGFTRDSVASGDPSRILPSEDGLRLAFSYTPLSANANVDQVSSAGKVSLLTKGSYVDIPVWDTIKRNHVDPGARGSLISVKPVGVLPGFAAPGSVRLFNYTILNEGAQPDVAMLSATFTGGKGWSATFAPADKLPLAPGEAKTVQAAVLVPGTAAESETVIFDFQVSSEKDPSAKASVATKVIASNEAGVPRELAPNLAPKTKSGLLPAPSALAAVSALGAVLAVWRRRAPPQA